MIKKLTTFLLLISITFTFCTACSSPNPDEIVDPPHDYVNDYLIPYDIENITLTKEGDKKDIKLTNATFEAYTVCDTSLNYSLNYRIYTPQCAKERPTPVLLFFHGLGEREPYAEPIKAYAGFKELFYDSSSPVYNSIVIVPRCPAKDTDNKETMWVDITDASVGGYSTAEIKESQPLALVLKLLKHYAVRSDIIIDRSAVYAMGLSMGGYACWDLLARHSNILAAAIPICGGGDVTKAEYMREVPIHTFHGTRDSIVPFEGTKRMVERLERLGAPEIIFTVYEDYEHNVWDMAMRTPNLIEWLYSHKK